MLLLDLFGCIKENSAWSCILVTWNVVRFNVILPSLLRMVWTFHQRSDCFDSHRPVLWFPFILLIILYKCSSNHCLTYISNCLVCKMMSRLMDFSSSFPFQKRNVW